MKKIYLLVVFIGLLIPLLLSFLIREIPNDTQPPLEGTRAIYKEITVTQPFISKMDNLSGIGTSIKNPNFRNRKNLILNLYSQDHILLRTVVLNGLNVPDGDFIKIRFQPIADSKNKKYYFRLSAPEATSEDSLEIFLTRKPVNWIEDAYINSNRLDAKMPFVIYHKPQGLFTVREIYGNFFRRLFADLPFALVYAFLVLILTGYLLYSKRESE